MNNWMVEAIASNSTNELARLQCADYLGRNMTRFEYLKEQGDELDAFVRALIIGRADAAWVMADDSCITSFLLAAFRELKISPSEKLKGKVKDIMLRHAHTEHFLTPTECLHALKDVINKYKGL